MSSRELVGCQPAPTKSSSRRLTANPDRQVWSRRRQPPPQMPGISEAFAPYRRLQRETDRKTRSQDAKTSIPLRQEVPHFDRPKPMRPRHLPGWSLTAPCNSTHRRVECLPHEKQISEFLPRQPSLCIPLLHGATDPPSGRVLR